MGLNNRLNDEFVDPLGRMRLDSLVKHRKHGACIHQIMHHL